MSAVVGPSAMLTEPSETQIQPIPAQRAGKGGKGASSQAKPVIYKPSDEVKRALGTITSVIEGLTASERGHVVSRLKGLYFTDKVKKSNKKSKGPKTEQAPKSDLNEIIDKTEEAQAFKEAKRLLKEALKAGGRTPECNAMHDELVVLQEAFVSKRDAIRKENSWEPPKEAPQKKKPPNTKGAKGKGPYLPGKQVTGNHHPHETDSSGIDPRGESAKRPRHEGDDDQDLVSDEGDPIDLDTSTD